MTRKKKYILTESLSVLIPAYNEEENIERVIVETLQAVKKFVREYEIVIVNDGSKDKTGEIIDRLSKRYKYVRPVHHKVNNGLGSALQTGVTSCKKDIIMYIEADGQSMLKDQGALLQKIKDADVVLGVRSQRVDYTLFRKVMSVAYILCTNIILGMRFKDLNWSQAYRRKIFKKIKMKSLTPFFTTEVAYKAQKAGFVVAEAPTKYRPRGGGSTSLGNLRTARNMLRDMIKLRLGIL